VASAAETHAPIVAALERGDGEAAGRLLREHAEMFVNPETTPPAAGECAGS
jgi:DNA-binding GntR family transcriptional regulator